MMKKTTNLIKYLSAIGILLMLTLILQSFDSKNEESTLAIESETIAESEKPEYFLLRPEVEKAFGYSHAVKIGNDIKISGAVSMDDECNSTAVGDLGQQMKNCYADLDKILKHYGCTFDDVVVENIFTPDMAGFLKNAAYRNTIYTKHFPTG